jgi:hypothetical protein
VAGEPAVGRRVDFDVFLKAADRVRAVKVVARGPASRGGARLAAGIARRLWTAGCAGHGAGRRGGHAAQSGPHRTPSRDPRAIGATARRGTSRPGTPAGGPRSLRALRRSRRWPTAPRRRRSHAGAGPADAGSFRAESTAQRRARQGQPRAATRRHQDALRGGRGRAAGERAGSGEGATRGRRSRPKSAQAEVEAAQAALKARPPSCARPRTRRRLQRRRSIARPRRSRRWNDGGSPWVYGSIGPWVVARALPSHGPMHPYAHGPICPGPSRTAGARSWPRSLVARGRDAADATPAREGCGNGRPAGAPS